VCVYPMSDMKSYDVCVCVFKQELEMNECIHRQHRTEHADASTFGKRESLRKPHEVCDCMNARISVSIFTLNTH